MATTVNLNAEIPPAPQQADTPTVESTENRRSWTNTCSHHNVAGKTSRVVEALLWTGGVLAVFVVGSHWTRSSYAQWKGAAEFAELRHSPRAPSNLVEGALYGRVAIPRLSFSAIVFEGVTEGTLDKGVGHLQISGAGNRHIALAGHRDTFFRSLRNIQVGDSIELSTPEGRNHYTVTSTAVVEPTDTEVIQPTPVPVVTLITCYPFSFLGAAPQRFIVRAALTRN